MLSTEPRLIAILDGELIGFLTAVDPGGQPQTAPVWFVTDGDDLVVYNKPDTPRLVSIRANPRVAFSLRGDRRATGAVLIEGTAVAQPDFPEASEFPGYVEKYGREIERLGWTPESFSADYSFGMRIGVTRVRAWGLDALDR